jgi:hypothetical protein
MAQLSPFLQGVLTRNQEYRQEQEAALRQQHMQLGLQGLMMKQQMAPLEMELIRAKVEQAREAARLAPQRAAMEHELNLSKIDKSRREGRMSEIQETGLAGLLQQMTRPYQSPQGVAPTDGSQGAPDMMAPNDQAAIQALQAAGRRPMRVDVGNPALTQAYQVMANPSGAIPEILRQQRPQTANESPIGKLMRERDALPPGHPMRAFYDQAIEKQSTHSPAVNVYSGSLTPGVDATGKPVFVQPSGRPDTPPRVVDNVFPAPKPATLRAIPTPLANKLTEAAELADATARFSSTFKDGFAGKTLTGDLSNTTGKLFGDSTGQAQWWQDYELHQSQIRNKLFGSALTPAEIEAWNKSAINPRMAPSEIRKNLTRRNTLENSGLNRLMKGVAAGGYNKEQIEAFTGRSVDGSAPPAAPSGPKRLRFDAQGNLVQ